ncbi:probable disease resistance protein At5g63020 [Brassica napus]|uniref:probable disease resistance protein At5g63020 n=1 Tax=Brassica napus TaxID=3708 RepID=UPI0006AB2D3C|nr:probable disease resistance protein At5g63020 [Brassica napus]
MGNVLSNGFQAATSFFLEKAKYILELEDNLEALQEVARRLKAMKDDLQNQLEMEERKGLRALEEIKVWLSEVKAIQPKVTKLLEDRTSEIERLSMCGYCSSNFFLTYRYSKDVLETVEKVQSILSSKPSGEVARLGPPPGIEEIATQRTVGLEKVLEATWSRLMEKEVGILGLYGMGGIGKTTLLKQINNKLLEKKDEFEVVIFVVVSQNLQVEKIQNEIGERLGLCGQAWEKKTQNEKASSICGALTRKRFVMLLDDIWRKVDLVEEIIGIPLPSPKNGSKVVFTTRSKNVCGRMGSHDLEVKQLDLLNAWELFRQKVRGNTLESDPKILELAIQICIKCRGLPLALNVIGETMACKTTVHEWQYAIDVLDTNAAKYREVEDEILKILKLSYDALENETVQQCFQYCALFPYHTIYKDLLVEYWISEGIINGGGDRERAINQCYSIIGTLISVCLLMPADTSEFVTMHDVIRQMGLWVASNFGEEEEKVIVKTGAGLQQMPEVRNWKVVRRMLLAKNKILNISGSPVCPNLTTLFLTYSWLVNISGEFFLSMPKLVLLDLSCNINLTKLPEEVTSLVSLSSLSVYFVSVVYKICRGCCLLRILHFYS